MADSQNSSTTREQCLYMARISNLAERYDEMMKYMSDLVRASTTELTSEEEFLLSAAFYRVISIHRSAWTKISVLEKNTDGNANDERVVSKILAQEYRANIEVDISTTCDGILKLLDEKLIPLASSSESKVLYFTVKGDYERYLAEIKDGVERREAAEKAMQSYQTAEQIALDLPPKHPRRLGVALNFAVFHSEILETLETCCSKARKAYNAAHSDESQLPDELQAESEKIMQRLWSNYCFWNAQRTLQDYGVQL